MKPWTVFYSSGDKMIKFCLLILVTLLVIWSFSHFMMWNETRRGVLFNDPILNNIPAYNVNTFIEVFTMIPIIISFYFIFQSPKTTVYFLFAAAVVCIFRSLSLYFVVLEAPLNIIPLTDPIIESLFYGGNVLVKDLFFSGHTANILTLGFIVQNKTWKTVIFSFGFMVGILLMVQHVHYSIDVFAAPIFAYLTYKISIYLGDKYMGLPTELPMTNIGSAA